MRHILLFLFIGTSIFFSCKKTITEPTDPTSPTKDSTVTVVPPVITPAKYEKEDTWIYQQMKKYYLWESQMPEEKNTNKNLAPEDYYRSILIKVGDFDRVSIMKLKADELIGQLSGNQNSYGFKYIKYQADPTSPNIKLAVSLVFKDSPAQKAGIERGDIIDKINNTSLTVSNVDALLELNAATFEVSHVNSSGKAEPSLKVNLQKVLFQQNPIPHFSLHQVGTKKVGYLVYTQFQPLFDNDLRNAFLLFKLQKIDEFILDLRFNPGGFTPSAEVLGSLIVPNLKPGSEMFHGICNASQTSKPYNPTDPSTYRGFVAEANNINLPRIYILTSHATSSSAELVINSLKPFMEVILVGDNTYGKNVISTVITDETGVQPFGLLPAWCQIFNIKGESNYGTKDGFIPNKKVLDDVMPLRPFGHPEETYFKAAMDLIAKNYGLRKMADDGNFKKVKIVD
ncbi:S41 family peptidase [Lacihabitans lacunae]|uniref:S41 family peptidase n=1 Tax=Lacihabitans lacunae TaxID=1028214 RepID=A0ABV7YXL8_9BACT